MENDLISRKALLDTMQNHFGQDLAYLGEDLQYCQEAVQIAPSIEAEPVRHGRWLLKHIGYGHCWMCSVCLKNPCIYVTEDTNYCPNCGSKMDAKEE